MTTPEQFDRLYSDTREPLLLEAYALTGDLKTSVTAVRDAFVTAWHRRRHLDRAPEPIAWLRDLVHADTHHHPVARRRHREKGMDPDVAATVEALGRLTSDQRRVLVLTHLADLTTEEVARLTGETENRVGHQLRTGTTTFARARDVPSATTSEHLAGLGRAADDVAWPSAASLRRTGTTRRRTHAVVGAALAVATLTGAGAVVSGDGARPTGFQREPTTPGAVVRPVAEASPPRLAGAAMLAPEQLQRLDPGLSWRVRKTHSNLDGDGLVVPCQTERFADPDATKALVRRFVASQGSGKDRSGHAARATELVEVSGSVRSARRAFATTRDWFSDCRVDRTQLQSTTEVSDIGDQASLFVLRGWGKDPESINVGVARTGRTTVTTVGQLPPGAATEAATATALAAAVNRLCGTRGAGTCAGPPDRRTVEPLPARPRGMLKAVDLPPVANARGPWVGTDPVPVRDNVAATRCDNTSFTGQGLRRDLTRTFLFPAEQARSFGLTQSVAHAPDQGSARAFVNRVRERIGECSQADLGTQADTLLDVRRAGRDLTVWDLTIELTGERTLEFWMAIMRRGTAVSQIGFVSESDMRMERADFRAVSQRALERLDELPGGR